MKNEQFLGVAVSLTSALANLHERDITHLHIRPQVIRIDDGHGTAELLRPAPDARLKGLSGPGNDAGVSAEMFPYMAPEQTGRINRPIDQRTDLYSLGVVFYEMLAGELPLQADNALGWVHCHVARLPRNLTEAAPDVPPALADIIMKLLAKEADDRYQSARGLMFDLEHCLVTFKARGMIEPFPLAMNDRWGKLRIPTKLYGREAERHHLFTAFERIMKGKTELALVFGYSGIGKSSLVHEIHQPIVREGGVFLEGKFDQYKRDVPYLTLAQAFREMMRQILGATETRLEDWRQQISGALGANAKLITDIIPQLELLIGKPPEVAPLPSTEAQNRFHAVFRKFIAVFAQQKHPLVIFLDDLQWADFASLKLIEHIVTHPDMGNLLIIGAYRDNEVGPAHALTTTVDAIRATKTPITEISLGGLSLGNVTELVADTFRCSKERSSELAELLYKKTGGNPFFLTQFLIELDREGLVRFERAKDGWTWDVDAISAKNYTDNVVDLMVAKLRRLPEATQNSMKLAACIGNEFDPNMLALIEEKSPEETAICLQPAAEEGFLLSRRGNYKFLHDRVQQAAYMLILEDSRAAVHLKIGRLLLGQTKHEDLKEKIFDIVNQNNLGVSLIHAPDEKLRLAELNLLAGKRAKASSAYQSALNYFSTGVKLLPKESWEEHYTLALDLHTELAECSFLTGDIQRAEELCANVVHTRTNIDRATFCRIRMQICLARGENNKAITLCVECVELLGIEIHTQPEKEVVLEAFQSVRNLMHGRRTEELLDLPVMTKPETISAMSVMAWIYPPAFYVDPAFTDLLVCTMVRLSILHGNAPASPHAYATFGAALCSKFEAYQEGYAFGKLACELTEKPGFIAFKSEVFQTHACLISIWTQHVRTQVEYAWTGFEAGRELGNTLYACFNLIQHVLGMLVRSDPLESVGAAAASTINYAINTKLIFAADAMISIQRLTMALRGLTDRLGTFSGSGFAEAAYETHLATENIPLIHFFYQVNKLQARFIAGEYDDAAAAGEMAKGLLWCMASAEAILVHEYYYYSALCAAARYKNAAPEQQQEFRALLDVSEARLRKWAAHCPANFRGTHALVCAEIARIEGRDGDAAKLYDEAIRASSENGFVQNEAVSAECAARFYIDRGFDVVPTAYLTRARACFTQWGAHAKVLQLNRLYASYVTHGEAASSASPYGGMDISSEQLDTIAAVKASHALSSDMGPDKLLSALMRVVIEHAGAQKACLFTPEGERLRLVAEAQADQRETNVWVIRDGERPVPDSASFPISVLSYVRRSRETVVLNDAAEQGSFSSDEYIARTRPRSLLCAPILRRGELAGILYLENRLISRMFTPKRLILLEFLATISLENATLHAEFVQESAERRLAEETLRQSEERLRRLVETASVIPWEADPATGQLTYVGPQATKMFGFPQNAWYQPGFLTERVHVEDRTRVLNRFRQTDLPAGDDEFEFRMQAMDGRVLWLHNVISLTTQPDGKQVLGGFLFDISQRKETEAILKDKLHIIQEQQDAIQRLSTPIIEVWEGVLTMPVFGSIDARRAQQMMEVLLGTIVASRCRYVIIDLTGVDMIDTSTADHIVKLIRSVQLLGSKGMVVGIRPEVARIVVSIGLDLSSFITLANLREALLFCMRDGGGFLEQVSLPQGMGKALPKKR